MSFINVYTNLLLRFLLNPTKHTSTMKEFERKCKENGVSKLFYPLAFYRRIAESRGVDLIQVENKFIHPDVLAAAQYEKGSVFFRRFMYPEGLGVICTDIAFCSDPKNIVVRFYIK